MGGNIQTATLYVNNHIIQMTYEKVRNNQVQSVHHTRGPFINMN